jgi:hypothetical protein
MIVEARAGLFKPLTIAIVLVGLAAAIWPLYREFFVNEWRERIAAGQPVVFVPDCPVVSERFRCGDRFVVTFRKDDGNGWCSRVRKNAEAEVPERCGLDIDAWDYARSVRYVTVEGIRLYYTWRGRVLSSQNQRAGWLVLPGTLAARDAHPLAMQ